jgi:hypothetical protein
MLKQRLCCASCLRNSRIGSQLEIITLLDTVYSEYTRFVLEKSEDYKIVGKPSEYY